MVRVALLILLCLPLAYVGFGAAWELVDVLRVQGPQLGPAPDDAEAAARATTANARIEQASVISPFAPPPDQISIDASADDAWLGALAKYAADRKKGRDYANETRKQHDNSQRRITEDLQRLLTSDLSANERGNAMEAVDSRIRDYATASDFHDESVATAFQVLVDWFALDQEYPKDDLDAVLAELRNEVPDRARLGDPAAALRKHQAFLAKHATAAGASLPHPEAAALLLAPEVAGEANRRARCWRLANRLVAGLSDDPGTTMQDRADQILRVLDETDRDRRNAHQPLPSRRAIPIQEPLSLPASTRDRPARGGD